MWSGCLHQQRRPEERNHGAPASSFLLRASSCRTEKHGGASRRGLHLERRWGGARGAGAQEGEELRGLGARQRASVAREFMGRRGRRELRRGGATRLAGAPAAEDGRRHWWCEAVRDDLPDGLNRSGGARLGPPAVACSIGWNGGRGAQGRLRRREERRRRAGAPAGSSSEEDKVEEKVGVGPA